MGEFMQLSWHWQREFASFLLCLICKVVWWSAKVPNSIIEVPGEHSTTLVLGISSFFSIELLTHNANIFLHIFFSRMKHLYYGSVLWRGFLIVSVKRGNDGFTIHTGDHSPVYCLQHFCKIKKLSRECGLFIWQQRFALINFPVCFLVSIDLFKWFVACTVNDWSTHALILCKVCEINFMI